MENKKWKVYLKNGYYTVVEDNNFDPLEFLESQKTSRTQFVVIGGAVFSSHMIDFIVPYGLEILKPQGIVAMQVQENE